jgi:hypothetical protein
VCQVGNRPVDSKARVLPRIRFHSKDPGELDTTQGLKKPMAVYFGFNITVIDI